MSEGLNTSDLDQALETPALSGTVQLARAALASSAPPENAEADSRRQMESLMHEAALSPRALREAVKSTSPRPWWQRLLFWKK